MAVFYILYSPSMGRYYTGSCKDIDMRLELHANKAFSKSFTTKADDWILYFSIEVARHPETKYCT
jgi:putative endonuclease